MALSLSRSSNEVALIAEGIARTRIEDALVDILEELEDDGEGLSFTQHLNIAGAVQCAVDGLAGEVIEALSVPSVTVVGPVDLDLLLLNLTQEGISHDA